MGTDETLLRFLLEDILIASAEERLPAPPLAPRFTVDTVRPGRAS